MDGQNNTPKIGLFLLAVGILCVLYRFIRCVREAKITPDPWGPEIDASLHQPDAVPICHRCLTPQAPRHDHWFCNECGAPVGDYNNYLPYVRIFSEGEVLRAGSFGVVRPDFFMVAGYFLYSLSVFAIFAPVYWYFLLRNLKRNATSQDMKNDADVAPLN